MSKIFISYARDGSHGEVLANDTQNQLEAAGFNVFRDATGLKGGDDWLHKIEQELRVSGLVVLILSEKVLDSKWVRREIILAEKLNIRIIPIFAELIDLPLWLVDLQALDFSEKKKWQQLLDAIDDHIETPSIFNSDVLASSGSKSTKIEDADKQVLSRYEKYLSANHSNKKEIDESIGQFRNYIIARKKRKHGSPSWASRCGEDRYGQYADIEVKNITQRFRLIDSGIFQMGSLLSEEGRELWGSKETPHQVTISQPFWLADTVCTQALWRAVMGYDYSYFAMNENNPVEMVSWSDTQAFLHALMQIKPLMLRSKWYFV